MPINSQITATELSLTMAMETVHTNSVVMVVIAPTENLIIAATVATAGTRDQQATVLSTASPTNMVTATDIVERVVMDLPMDPLVMDLAMDPLVMDLAMDLATNPLVMAVNHPVTVVIKTNTETDKNMEVMVILVARAMLSQAHTEAVSKVRATVRMANPTTNLRDMVAMVITMERTMAAEATVTDMMLSAQFTEEAKLIMEMEATNATTRMVTN